MGGTLTHDARSAPLPPHGARRDDGSSASARALLNVLGRAALLLQPGQLGLGLLHALLALGELAALHRGRLAVEDEDGLDARLHHPDRPVEHPRQVRRDLAGLVGELALAAREADLDEEL
eukprot:2649135-Prymnesium_polylepis.2